MHELQIRIKINNITNTQRAVYRTLRKRMGLQRQEANFAMLGYVMAEQATKTPFIAIIDLAETIFRQANIYTNPELDKLIHEWQHAVVKQIDTTGTKQITITEIP